MTRYTEPKPEHGSQAWLDARWQNSKGEKRITASVAGAVHNQHRFMSSADLACELLALEPPAPKVANKSMTRGNVMEPLLGRMVEEQFGVELYQPDVMFVYDEPGVRLLSNVDFQDMNTGTIWEAKTFRGTFDGVLPDYWRWQGVQLAVCCDVAKIEWVVFDSDLEAKFHTQTVSSDERQVHIEACRNFLSFIDMGMMPPDAVPTYRNASDLYADATATTIELDAAVYDTLERLAFAKAQVKEGEAVIEAAQGEIGMLLGDNEYGTIGGTRVVSWKSASRESFDQKTFTAEHPALAEKFRKTSTYRTMRVTKGDK